MERTCVTMSHNCDFSIEVWEDIVNLEWQKTDFRSSIVYEGLMWHDGHEADCFVELREDACNGPWDGMTGDVPLWHLIYLSDAYRAKILIFSLNILVFQRVWTSANVRKKEISCKYWAFVDLRHFADRFVSNTICTLCKEDVQAINMSGIKF